MTDQRFAATLPQWLLPLDAEGFFGTDADERPWMLMDDGEWELTIPGRYVQDLLARREAEPNV